MAFFWVIAFLAKQLAKAIAGLGEVAAAFGVWGLIEIR
jgi:hypothetical protein